MKKIIILLLVLTNVFVANAESCSCGSFESGTYDYTIKDGSGDCCSGSSGGQAYFTTWSPGSGRSWVVKDIKKIEFSDAIKSCCPNV